MYADYRQSENICDLCLDFIVIDGFVQSSVYLSLERLPFKQARLQSPNADLLSFPK